MSNNHPMVERFGAPDALMQVNLSQIAFPGKAVPILGFGGAFTEAAALNYQSLTETGKDTVMELLFGKSGLGYSLGRVHINSIDFSVEAYSFDTTDGDFSLKDFDNGVHHDVETGMVDMALRATSVFREGWGSTNEQATSDGQLQLFASPWSPPPWMKAPTPDDKPGALHAENMTNSAQPVCIRDGAGPESRYAKAW
jgi:glucosylceramidase